MQNYMTFTSQKRKRNSFSSQDSLDQQSHRSQPSGEQICSIVQGNILKNLLIKLTYRRINWGLQIFKLLEFDISSIIDISQQSRQKSKSQILTMTCQNFVLTLDKVLIIKIQNKLSDGFLRMKLISRKRQKKVLKTQHKVSILICKQIFNKRLSNAFSSIIRYLPQPPKRKVMFGSMQIIDQSISKYKSQINRLERQSYKTQPSRLQNAPTIYIPKQSYRQQRKSVSTISSLVSQFQHCLSDMSNYNFKKKKYYEKY